MLICNLLVGSPGAGMHEATEQDRLKLLITALILLTIAVVFGVFEIVLR